MAFITSGSSGLVVNHSPSDQESTTLFAFSFVSANSMTSCLALNISNVWLKPSAAREPTSGSSNRPINDSTLYPPSIVPSNLVACFLSINGEVVSPLATAVKNAALTYAAGSTPAGVLFVIKSKIYSSSPLGGDLSSSTSSVTCSALSGRGGMPCSSLSFTWVL